jgi:UDP-N-acetyl-D-galactosamine dehydrogenase
MSEKIAVIGLGYVGLPAAVALGREFPGVIGFDINKKRIADLCAGVDATDEIDLGELKKSKVNFTADANDLKDSTFFIVTVPTPIDDLQRPDLSPLEGACKTVAPHLKKNDIVVFESTVYPGVTERHCGALLEKLTGLKSGVDFFLGYSPERISPGDKERRFETIVKIIAAQDAKSLARVKAVYGAAVTAGLHEAPSIKVAEAAKVIENVQRDVNIALMNELAMIFHRAGIKTKDVLDAAGTKWNFLKFTPGLVGGHCIGVDPYYLTTEAERLGYFPHLILAGRRINDGMGVYIAEQIVKNMIALDLPVKNAKIGILGITFKEDVPDLRNSRVPDILNALREYGPKPIIHDVHADGAETKHEYGLDLAELNAFKDLDVLIVAVSHKDYKDMGAAKLAGMMKKGGLFVDIKSIFDPAALPEGIRYWSL